LTTAAKEQNSRPALGIFRLEEFWARATRRSANHAEINWRDDRILIDGLGLSLEETLQYLGREQPTLAEFEQWILERNDGEVEPLRVERINAALSGNEYGDELKRAIKAIEDSPPVLSSGDMAFWEGHGYVIVHDAVSRKERRAAESAVWKFLDMDANDPESWYAPSDHGIMRQFFHDPALRANRRSLRIHKAFSQIWGTADLWMTVDRVSFNPPERDNWKFTAPNLHWDTTLAPPVPFGVSGLIYLTDTNAEQGAFTCVPGFHRRIDRWVSELPPGADPRTQDLESLGAVPIAGKAGDLIIWHKALPHGSRPNSATRPRIVQYLSMHPTKSERPVWV
jgi:hypothetical protein